MRLDGAGEGMKGKAIGIGEKGERLPHTPEQVREIVDAALKDGDSWRR